uniref:Uncharacterized protein n=1 Tax=Arundo donax TaxID=35708 RepID=A0A0A9BCS0_ARUDO
MMRHQGRARRRRQRTLWFDLLGATAFGSSDKWAVGNTADYTGFSAPVFR